MLQILEHRCNGETVRSSFLSSLRTASHESIPALNVDHFYEYVLYETLWNFINSIIRYDCRDCIDNI